jgi:hypothetical protein
MNFDAYVYVDQELATCGVLCMEEMCGVVESGSCVEEGQCDGGVDDNEAKSEPVLSFTEALHAFESITAFMYAYDITKETKRTSLRLLFSLKRNSATKQMINDFFNK